VHGCDAAATAQNRDAKPNAAARAANAPPLVPVRLNVDGNFRIAPLYAADPMFTRKPDVPQGRVIRLTMNSAESKLFPTAPAGRGAGGPARGRGEATPAVPAEPPQHQTFQRQVAVYVPAGYVANTPAPFIVVQDERWFVPEDAPTGPDGKPHVFDLSKDVGERNDLTNQRQDVARRLRPLIAAWEADVDAEAKATGSASTQ
jgi:hypothetical protein